MKEFNYNEICQMLIGSVFLSGGAGGSLEDGIQLFDHLKDAKLKLYEEKDLKENTSEEEYGAILSIMGIPSPNEEHDLTTLLTNTIHYMRKRCTACTPYKKITHVLPIGYGGINTAVPVYLAMTDPEFKLADADGAGRSVPGLETTLVSLNGAPIIPFALTNEQNDSLCLDLTDNTDAARCERVCKHLCATPLFDSLSGVAGWPMKASSITQYANPSSLSYAQALGSCIMQYSKETAGKDDSCVFDYLNDHMDGFQSRILSSNTGEWTTTLSRAGRRQLKNGTSLGYIQVKSKTEKKTIRWEIHFINESIIIYENSDKALDAPLMTAPDIICLFDETDKVPLTNDYIVKHIETIKDHKVSLGVLPAPAKWWENRDTKQMTEIWKKYYEALDYHGICLRYENIESRM